MIKIGQRNRLKGEKCPSGYFIFFLRNYNTEFEEVVFSELSEAINRLLFMSSKSLTGPLTFNSLIFSLFV